MFLWYMLINILHIIGVYNPEHMEEIKTHSDGYVFHSVMYNSGRLCLEEAIKLYPESVFLNYGLAGFYINYIDLDDGYRVKLISIETTQYLDSITSINNEIGDIQFSCEEINDNFNIYVESFIEYNNN